MNHTKNFLVILFSGLLFSCGQQSGSTDNAGTTGKADSSIVQTAKEAFAYGLPLVLMDITRRQMTSQPGSAMYSTPNQFRHNSFFPDASFKNVVRPNADTYYSIAWLDLEKEPMILSLPNTKDRYYMMPMMDAYTNVFASPGSRTTGNEAGNYLISGPGWTGEVAEGMKQIQSPTNTVWIIGRTQVNSKEDGDKIVVPLQRQYKLTPLSAWGKPYTPPTPVADSTAPKGDPNTLVKNMPTDEYFSYVNELLAKYPPPTEDKAAMDKFAAIGIGAGKKFDLNAFPADAKEAVKNIPTGTLDEFTQQNSSVKDQLVNGWYVGRKVIGTYGTDYASRASVSYFGLGANLREDAIYPSAYFDKDGNKLNGEYNYVLHFDKGKTPPAKAFWSLTMYDPEGYFVDNPINRYAIGDRSNMKANADGSIDIYIQKDNPGKEKASNWLPAPAGDFNLIMRVYWPKDEMLNGSWIPPGVIITN